jgi:hypothetical protein
MKIRHPLKHRINAYCLTHINITKRGEIICFSTNKFAPIIAKTNSDTHHIHGRRKRSVNVTFIPSVSRLRPFHHITIARIALVSHGDIFSSRPYIWAVHQSSRRCFARSTTCMIVSFCCCHNFKFLRFHRLYIIVTNNSLWTKGS